MYRPIRQILVRNLKLPLLLFALISLGINCAYQAQGQTSQDPFYSGAATKSVLPPNTNYPGPNYQTPGYQSPSYPIPQNNQSYPNSSAPSSPYPSPSSPTNLSPALHNRSIDLTNEAFQLSKSGNNQQAIELLKQALSIEPSSSVAHLNMSVALIALKRYDEALNEATIVLRLNPNEEKGYLNYLAAAIGANHMQDALRVGQEYLARFPNGQNRTILSNEMFAVAQEIDHRSKIHGLMAPPGAPDNYLFLVTPYGKRRWMPFFMPLRVYIYPGQNSKGFTPLYESTLISSFMNWQNLSRGLIRFIPVTDPTQANIECRWTDSTVGLKLAAEAGDTEIFADKKNNIYHSIITILTCRPDIPTEQLTPTLMRQVCLHEIGHVLGLDGHSDNAQDIMYCATDPNVEKAEISQRDINTLFLIYQ
jgi:tetratricopeptide (TPR) repeat protein